MSNSHGICNNCHKPRFLVNLKYRLCIGCNRLRLDERAMQRGNTTPKERVAYKSANTVKPRKATGEGLLMLALAEKLPHICFICGAFLRPITYSSMAHVLSKKQFPAFRLYDKNIVFLCAPLTPNGCNAHNIWDCKAHSELRDLPQWNKMFTLEEQLKKEYSAISKNDNSKIN